MRGGWSRHRSGMARGLSAVGGRFALIATMFALALAAPPPAPALAHSVHLATTSIVDVDVDENDGAGAAEDAALDGVSFAFKGATFEEVLDYFSRVTKLPVVRETDVPEGTLDYVSQERYTVDEALRVLNIILQSRGVTLRVEDEMLYLQKLDAMAREAVDVYVGQVPAEVTGEKIITFVMPLTVASATSIAEKLAEMVASYGSVSAMPAQNALVITETAAQVRRLVQIVAELDRDDPEGAIRVFQVRHVNAKDLEEPLKALLSEKVVKYVVNAKGKQTKIDEETTPGLKLTIDERTNSVIAKGVESRIEKLGEVLQILDVPEAAAGAGRTMRTIALMTSAPADIAAQLTALYAKLPEADRPTVIPLTEVGKVSIVGRARDLDEGEALIREIDGGAGTSVAGGAPRIHVLPLEHASPSDVIAAVTKLLNRRQQASLKLVPGPDGASIIASGDQRDVAAVEALVPAIDAPRRAEREVRIVRITTPDPADTIQRAEQLYGRQVDADEPTWRLTMTFDAPSRTLTLIGPRGALDRFSTTLRTVESSTVVDRETRQFTLTSAAPSQIVSALSSLAQQTLRPTDGSTFIAPDIQPVDALDQLIITAPPAQFGTLESLVRTLDQPRPGDFAFQVVNLTGVNDVDALLKKADLIFERRTRGYETGERPAPEVELDAATGAIMLTGRSESVREYQTALAEARKLLPPARDGRMITLDYADAADIIAPLRELLDATIDTTGPREVAPPAIEIVEATNALYVVAEAAQHDAIARAVRMLDTVDQSDLPPLRLLQVRAADAQQLAGMLRNRYASRPADVRRAKPVEVDADASTNTLIVTAHTDVFDEIKEFVDSVNRADENRAERETMLFPLKRARASELSSALERLYPEPPMPLDRRGRPMPHLREPKEVHVSADAATNTLIVEAPAERRAQFEALVEQLDRVELPPSAQLRTYPIPRGDAGMIARTLTELARRGVLSAPPVDGGKSVEVTIQAEPLSRTLIVAGDEVTFEKVEQMLKEIGNVPIERSLRVFEINGADPADVAAQAERLYTEQTAEMPNAGAVSVEVDPDGSTLLVVADDEAMVRFARILTELQAAIGPPPDVRLIALEHAKAEEVVAFLQGMLESDRSLMLGGEGGPRPTFEAIARTNSIVVAARREQHDVVRSLVRSFDVPENQEMPPLRILQLRSADAANLATALTRQYNQRPPDERRVKPVNITADPNTNALMVAAHPEMLPEIQAIVTELNSATRMNTEGREIRIFPLKVARAEELARTIDEMYPEPPMPLDRRGRPMPHLREAREVVVRADAQTNSLIVDAPVQRMAGFEQLVEQLDRQKMLDETQMRSYRITHADLQAITQSLRELAAAGALSPGGGDRRTPITITSESASQTLLVSGPTEIFPRVEQVLADLDAKPAAPATTLRLFPLANARAESVAPILRDILITRITEEVPDAGARAEALLNIATDPKTNTLIISGPNEIMPVVEQLLEQLDNTAAALDDPVIRVRPLDFADAAEVSRALSQALPNVISKSTGEPVDVKIIPAPGSNALLMVGSAPDLDEIDALVEPLDARPSMDAIGAETFKLEHADALQIAGMVEKLLNDQQQNDPWVMREIIRRTRGQGLAPRIRVEADARTNALIVSGPQRTVSLAGTLIAQLDAPDPGGVQTYLTFTPANIEAATLVPMVRQVIDATRPAGRRSSLELVAEPRSGVVVVIGPQEEADAAVALLKEWDDKTAPAPQVDLRVVTLDHASASSAARTISPLLRDRSRWPDALRRAAEAGVPVSEPTVTADDSTNRLMITAPEMLMASTVALIEQIDRPAGEATLDTRVFSLRQADAADVASAVQRSVDARAQSRPGAPKATVAAEPSSNSVIVTAAPAEMATIAAMIEPLDAEGRGNDPQVRTILLKHARAEAVAPVVEQLLGVEEFLPEGRIPSWQIFEFARLRQQQAMESPDIRVAADVRLNALVISAPPAMLDMAEAMVAQLDVDDAAGTGTRSVRVLALENVDAAALAENLEAIFDDPDATDPKPTVRVEPASNSLIVRATNGQFAVIEDVVQKIDNAAIASSRQMRTISIDPARADAADVARTLERLLDRGRGNAVEVITVEELLERRRRKDAGRGGSSDARPGLDARFIDHRLRPLLPMLRWTAVAMIAAPGDLPDPTPAQREWAEQFRQAFAPPSSAPAESTREDAAPMTADEAPATDDDDEGKQDAANDAPSAPAPSATEPAPADAAPVDARADGVSNRSVVADEDDGPSFAELLEAAAAKLLAESEAARTAALDGPGAAPSDPVVEPAPIAERTLDDVPVANVLAVNEIQTALQEDADVTIAIDPATNSLVVLGSSRAVERIADLAAQLESELPQTPGVVRYIALPETVDVRTTAQLITQTLGRLFPAERGRNRGPARAVVLADETNNGLIVVASDPDFETVADLVAAMANPPQLDEMIVKIYPLSTITADRAAESVRTLIEGGAGVAGDSRSRRNRRSQPERMREIDLTLMADGREIAATFDPNRLSVAADAQTNAIIVVGPAPAVAFLDQYVELIDRTPTETPSTLRLYSLALADAADVRNTLRDLFRRRFRNVRDQLGPNAIEPDFAVDARTNTLLVTAAPEQLVEVEQLLKELDRPLNEARQPLRVVELKSATPSEAQRVIEAMVIAGDQARRASTQIVANDDSGVLLVRADDAIFSEIESLLEQIDREATSAFKVRTLTVLRANAEAVAEAVQKFYDDRARIASSARGRRSQERRISIIGDANSNTLLIAAADDDFEEIRTLVERFDSEEANQTLSFRIFELKHAKAQDIQETVSSLVQDLTWNRPFFFFNARNSRQDQDSFAVRADDRLNALIVTGRGDKFEVVEKIIETLDVPAGADQERIVRLYEVENAGLDTMAQIIRDAFNEDSSNIPWWRRDEVTAEVKVTTDENTGMLIVFASGADQTRIEEMIGMVDAQAMLPDQATQVVSIEFAEARDLARTLNDFLRNRAEATNDPDPNVAIIASESANTLLISAASEDMATIRDLIQQMDQPAASGDRTIEIVTLTHADPDEVARILGEQFPQRGGKGLIITPDVRTGTLILNAPRQQYAQAEALIARLDTPNAADETRIRFYELDAARADDVVALLAETLQLDATGETDGIVIRLDDADLPPVEVKAKIVADNRSNSVIVTATEDSFPVIEALISQVDAAPAANPQEYRIIPLEHAIAVDVAFTLRQFTRSAEPAPSIDYNRIENQLIVAATADQFEQIEKILEEIDVPAENQRVTDFVALQFADAAKIQEALSVFYGPFSFEADTPGKLNVKIVADPATNSLVISADEAEWEGIRALLSRLDSEEYDASLQLRVLPLLYADARSVARAINEAFQSGQQNQRRGGRDDNRRNPNESGPPAGDNERREDQGPSVLLEADEWVRASAEPLTNSVILSANRQNLLKIERIIEQLDVADYTKLPPPRLIPITAGSPDQIAQALRSLYGGEDENRGRKSLRIVADQSSNTIIVRTEEEDFAQIRALAEALQQEAESQGLSVKVLTLDAAPAVRVADAVRNAFAAKARQSNQPLTIEVDAAGNSLIVASTAPLFDEIEAVVRELDQLSPAANQSIFIIELEHLAPDAAKNIIETIGLNQPPRRESGARIVTEPVSVSVLPGRQAIVIVASPADRDTIVALVKSLDAAPEMAEAEVRVVQLRNAAAPTVVQVVSEILDPETQQSNTGVARALREQVRRLAIRSDDNGDPRTLDLDLTKPTRVIADEGSNTVIISSTPDNVAVLESLVEMFDTLPITAAATVQLFPLENIAASDFARIVRELFEQGKQIGTRPGRRQPGMPDGMVGAALIETIAMSVDDRTNTVIVAGPEEAVALVEVLSKRVDSDIVAAWVEPRIIPLRHADAENLAELINAVVVEGSTALPQANPLQRQIGRLRAARDNERGNGMIESDVFQPMSRFLVRAERQLNALILVGTPANLDLVAELVTMLDVEAASPSAVVRIYPVEHASATRLAQTVTRLFDQQVDSKAIRPEDRVIVQPDERTNALVVTTSPRSFAVLESLIDTLDREIAPDLREIRRIELQNASAVRLAELVQNLMDARQERLEKIQPETADLERATIIAEPRTNSLVVAAGNESFDVIQRLVADLDTDNLVERGLVNVITLDSGNVDRIAETINQLMERRYADLPADVQQSQRPLVLTDPRTSSLLIAASEEDFVSIEALVAQLEAAPINPAVGLHVIALQTGDPERLAPRLEQLMQQRQQSLGDARTPLDEVSIEPDLASNSLIVAATAENLEVIEGLLDALQRAGAESDGVDPVEVISLTSSDAATIVDLVNELYVDEVNRTQGRDAVRVSADDRLNAVVVSAGATDAAAIRDLVERLDGARPSNVVEIKYIPLASANALETVSLIENVLAGRGIERRFRRSDRAIVIKYLRELADVDGDEDDAGRRTPNPTGEEEMEVSSAIRESITLTPDVRTNTVIVAAPRQAMTMIENMIRDLDNATTGAQSIRIFTLTNADATAMADILSELFSLQQQGSLYVLKPRESLGGAAPAAPGVAPEPGGFDGGFIGSELTAVPDERQQLSITVDTRTNSLLVSGSPTYLDLVEDVVDKLDAEEANERVVEVYPLRNAVANEVAQVITDFVQAEQQKLIETLGADQIGSAARLLEREVTIVGDDKSNTVLISASPRYMDRVMNMVMKLDVDPPQVLIQVLLAEVTLDDGFDWGADMTGTFGDVTAMSDLLSTTFAAGAGTPNLSIAGSDFNLLFRALQSQGRIQILSNPSVMAANNEQARIQVGEIIQLPTGTSFDQGTQQSTVDAEPIGVILDVLPSINPDGFVRMNVSPEISILSDRTTQINEEFSAPVIITRNATTTVTVRDGETIVIGGLISDRVERRKSKVPLLGDIPLLGAAFTSVQNSSIRTELLIVLTPHVVRSPTELGRATEVSIEHLSLPEDVKEAIRKSVIDGTGGLYDANGNPIEIGDPRSSVNPGQVNPRPRKKQPNQ